MSVVLELSEAEALMAMEAISRRLDEVQAAHWMAKRERNIRLEALWSAAGKIRAGLSEGRSHATDELRDASWAVER